MPGEEVGAGHGQVQDARREGHGGDVHNHDACSVDEITCLGSVDVHTVIHLIVQDFMITLPRNL